MSLIRNPFFEQVSIASIKKRVNRLSVDHQLNFWEAEIDFKHNKSDFKFNVHEPERNSVTKKIIKGSEIEINDAETRFKTELHFEKKLNRRGNVKRFYSKEEAEFYILFNLIQIFKPIKNYVDNIGAIERFNTLLEKYPEKFVKELGSGKSWLAN